MVRQQCPAKLEYLWILPCKQPGPERGQADDHDEGNECAGREKNIIGTLISDIVLTLLSYVAENERANIRQRQAEEIAAAKARGVRFGRPPKPLPDNFYDIYQRWRMKKITINQAAAECGMPRSTFFSKADKFGKATFPNLCKNPK